MTVDYFDPIYRLEVGLPGEVGTSISGLQVTFEVTKSTGKEANKANIQITNLESGKQGEWLKQRDLRVRLFAGWRGRSGDGQPQLIFEGRIGKRGVLIVPQPPNELTVLECLDDLPRSAGSGRATFNWHFEGGTTNRQILDQIIREARLRRGFIAELPLQTYKTGVTFMGTTSKALTKLLRPAGLGWSIQDGRLQVSERGKPSGVRAPRLSATSGLLDSPTRTDKGINAKSFLNSNIVPGGALFIESRFITGIYRARNVTHRGDFRGSEWSTQFEAKLIADASAEDFIT
jgi:hypothetical protein